jgi:hypothetical protein
MIIQHKVTTLQVVRDSYKEKPKVYLKHSSHSIRDTIPVIVDITSSDPISINNIGITFKIYHQLTGILLKQYDTDSFVFPIVEMQKIQAISYVNGSDIPIFYSNKSLEFSNRIHKIVYELIISAKTTRNISKFTDSGEFYIC